MRTVARVPGHSHGKQSREARCDDPPKQRAFSFLVSGTASVSDTFSKRGGRSNWCPDTFRQARPDPRAKRCQTPGYDGFVVRKVLLASPRGYCAGVERAVETVEKALDLYGPPVYVRKQIVHNLHVVRDLEARGAVFVDEETEVPEGETVVFSAHGVAPSVHANAATRRLNTIDATCPLVTKVHVQARRYAANGYTVLLIGHEGHEEVVGTMGEAPDSIVLVESVAGRGAARVPGGRAARVRDADDAVGRRDGGDHQRAAAALPRDPRAEEGRHLLRDLEPPVGGEGDALRDRPAARDRLAQLLELEPARRGRARQRRRRAPDRRRDGDRRVMGRRTSRSSASRRARRRRRSSSSACASGSGRAARRRSSRTGSSTRTSSSACRWSCAASSRSRILRTESAAGTTPGRSGSGRPCSRGSATTG